MAEKPEKPLCGIAGAHKNSIRIVAEKNKSRFAA